MKRLRILIALCLLLVSTAWGAITRTQAWSANATSVTITSTSNGDLIIVFAYNGSASTAPTVASGFTTLDSGIATNQGFILGWKASTGGDTSSGTWTSATAVVCHVYSGATIGADNRTNGTGTTITYPALTMQVTDGTSWVTGFGGARTATAGMDGSTTLLTNRTSQTTVNGLDSGTGLTSYAGETLNFTTTSRWFGITVEILAAAGAPTANTNFFIFLQP
jgi:hypothetical protein